jgi:hypothetical protein
MLDVNILIAAHRPDLPTHPQVRRWLDEQLAIGPPLAIPSVVCSGFIRIVTRPPFKPATSVEEAFGFCDWLLSHPTCTLVEPGAAHWGEFGKLCRAAGTPGNLTTDAYLAAMAIERGAEWVTLDKDFARFPGLTWRSPGDPQSTTNPR